MYKFGTQKSISQLFFSIVTTKIILFTTPRPRRIIGAERTLSNLHQRTLPNLLLEPHIMRKNSSKSFRRNEEVLLGDFDELSDDEFFEMFDKNSNRRRNQRKRDARRQIERYKEDKELAGWINDYHYDTSD